MVHGWEDGIISNGRGYYWGMFDNLGKENDFREEAHRPMGFTKKLFYIHMIFVFLW